MLLFNIFPLSLLLLSHKFFFVTSLTAQLAHSAFHLFHFPPGAGTYDFVIIKFAEKRAQRTAT